MIRSKASSTGSVLRIGVSNDNEKIDDAWVAVGAQAPYDEPADLQNWGNEPTSTAEDEDKPFNMNDVADDVWVWASENARRNMHKVIR